MIKRILFTICALVLLTALAMPAFAAGTAEITITPSKNAAYRGDTVEFTVNISSVANCKAVGVMITYDTSVFEMVSGSCVVSDAVMRSFDAKTGNGELALESARTLSGAVFKFTLKVKADARLGAAASVSGTASVRDTSGYLATTVKSATVTVACRHSFGSWKKVDGNNHSRTCSVCKEVETKAHRYDNACDTSCNDCGHTRTIKHNFSTQWSANGQYHWHGCTVCGAWNSDSAAHTPGDPATEEHAQNCTVCGYELAPQLEHVHVPIKEWLFDEVGHWYACERCEGKAELADHDFTAECDSVCDTCGYERETVHTPGAEWITDESGHWHVCQVCQEVVDKTAHVSDNDPAAPKCADCGFDLLHTHVFGAEWSTDGENHWHGCACGEKQELGAHDWDDGALIKAPTAQEKGEMLIRCIVCGAEHKAVVMAMEVEKPSLQGLLYWQIACGVLALLLVAALVFFIVVITKINKKPKGKFAGK